MSPTDFLIECQNAATTEAGMAFLFRERAKRLGKYVKILKILTILVLIVPGAVALAYGSDSSQLKTTIDVFLILSIIMAIITGLSFVLKWDEKQAYYYESASHHAQLNNAFDLLWKKQNKESAFVGVGLAEELKGLQAELKIRDQQDDKFDISPRDERKALRYGLRQYQRKCVGCTKIPSSLEPTECNVCGNF